MQLSAIVLSSELTAVLRSSLWVTKNIADHRLGSGHTASWCQAQLHRC